MSGFSALDVIKEVKIRPGIYDRKSLEPPRWEHRQQLWLEVAESVTPSNEWENFSQEEKETRIGEVANKWKNLRDHFYREVKLIEAGDTNKKRKYIYYDEMEFVRPFIGYKSAPKKKRQKDLHESSADDFKLNDSDIDMEAFLNLKDDDNKVYLKKEPQNQPRSINRLVKSSVVKHKQNVPNNMSKSGQRVEIKNFDLLRKNGAAKNPTFKIRESDISFCLSLVQHLRELSGARKLSAKIDILKVLHKNIAEVERKDEKSKICLVNESDDMKEDTDDDVDFKQDDPLIGKRRYNRKRFS